MTAEQYWEWLAHQDDSDCRFELHDGNVIRFPLMGEQHGVVCASLCYLLGKHLIDRRAGLMMSNNVALLVGRDPDTLLGPDLLAFGSAKLAGGLSDSFCTTIPDLVVEVTAPEDEWPAMLWRVERYLGHGVPLVWVVQPGDRSIVVFRPGEGQEELRGQVELTGIGSLAELRLPVAEVFRLPGEGKP